MNYIQNMVNKCFELNFQILLMSMVKFVQRIQKHQHLERNDIKLKNKQSHKQFSKYYAPLHDETGISFLLKSKVK